jgi:hypothetical protein
MKVLKKFFSVLILIVIGAGWVSLLVSAHRSSVPSADDNYKACLQDVKIGMPQHNVDSKWFNYAASKCIEQYFTERTVWYWLYLHWKLVLAWVSSLWIGYALLQSLYDTGYCHGYVDGYKKLDSKIPPIFLVARFRKFVPRDKDGFRG